MRSKLRNIKDYLIKLYAVIKEKWNKKPFSFVFSNNETDNEELVVDYVNLIKKEIRKMATA